MERWIKILGGALAVQLVLLALTWTASGPGEAKTETRSLLGINASDIAGIKFEGKPDDPADQLELGIEDRNWVLASADGYPVRQKRVNDMAQKLAELRVGDPIASTPASHLSLGVADHDYGRRVTVTTKDGKASTLLIGRGPRSAVHVRPADSNDVYSARGMTLNDFRSDPKAYVTPDYLNVDRETLVRVTITNEFGTLDFAKNGDTWTLAQLPPGAELDTTAAQFLRNAVGNVNLTAPVGSEIKPEYGLDGSRAVVLVAETPVEGDDGETRTETETIRYVIGNRVGETDIYVKADSSDWVILAPRWTVDLALIRKLVDFVKSDEPKATPPAAGGLPAGFPPEGLNLPPGFGAQ